MEMNIHCFQILFDAVTLIMKDKWNNIVRGYLTMHIKCPDSSTKILSSAIQKMARNTPAWMWTMANASPKPITWSKIKLSENAETDNVKIIYVVNCNIKIWVSYSARVTGKYEKFASNNLWKKVISIFNRFCLLTSVSFWYSCSFLMIGLECIQCSGYPRLSSFSSSYIHGSGHLTTTSFTKDTA